MGEEYLVLVGETMKKTIFDLVDELGQGHPSPLGYVKHSLKEMTRSCGHACANATLPPHLLLSWHMIRFSCDRWFRSTVEQG